MNPLFLIAIPIALGILAMILNSPPLAFDHSPSSSKPDPVKKLAAERETYRQFFDRRRKAYSNEFCARRRGAV